MGSTSNGISRRGAGISKEQLYSTKSYQERDLAGINLFDNYQLSSNVDLSDQNLQNANLEYISFILGSLDGADFRGAAPFDRISGSTSIRNVIFQDGGINGLDLNGGRQFLVRDYDGNSPYRPSTAPTSISVSLRFVTDGDSVLKFALEDSDWGSTILFRPGIPVTLGGTLELNFAFGVNVGSQVGRTIRLFDWTGVSPTGQFNVVSPYAWDLSRLYSNGEVTLVPEPSAIWLTASGVIGFGMSARGRRPRQCWRWQV